MSEKIPYHPSLTIGNIVQPSLKKIFDDINKEVKLVERAKDKLNSLISSYRSLEMTEREINSLSVDINTNQLEESKKKLKQSIEEAAKNYVELKITKEEEINNLQLSLDNQDYGKFAESPIDYAITEEIYHPWGVDSLKLDYQYFSFQGNQQVSETIDNMKSFLDNSTQNQASPLTKTALSQLQSQHDNHNIKGTLVMSATCTHKNVMILEPFKLDSNKAVNAWNTLYEEDFIDIHNKENLLDVIQSSQQDQNKMTLLSGAVYGSCFIAMVHFLKKDKTTAYQYTGDFINEIQKKLTLQKWLAYEKGNLQIDQSQEAYIKNLLSDEDIDIHLNLYVTGAIPKIGSQKIASAVKQFSKNEYEEKNLKPFANEDVKSLGSISEQFKKEAKVLSIRDSMTSQLLNSLEKIDKKENSILDTNTMITAFENYVTAITSSSKDRSIAGVPIHYYTTSYTKADIIKLWIEEHKDINEE